jgi:predicted metal-dependent phosphoesterase TrpH
MGSKDASIDTDALFEEALGMGINGICVCEHFDFNAVTKESYLQAYKSYIRLKELAENTDLKVFPGIEIKVSKHVEYLVYGVVIPYEILLLEWSEAVSQIENLGGLVVRAHPFRDCDECLSCKGVEIYNRKSLQSENLKCLEWIKQQMQGEASFYYTVGSDAHDFDEIGSVVAVFHGIIEDDLTFVSKIKSKSYEGFIIDGSYLNVESLFSSFGGF